MYLKDMLFLAISSNETSNTSDETITMIMMTENLATKITMSNMMMKSMR